MKSKTAGLSSLTKKIIKYFVIEKYPY